MKNKELVKQLEGVGFERLKKGCLELLELRIKKHYCFRLHIMSRTCPFYCYFKHEYVPGLTNHLEKPTFTKIIEAIKEHTGVDLAKKTKREEIEELKVRLGKMEDAMKSQNDVIEGLKGRISPSKRKYFFGVDYGSNPSETAIALVCNQGGSLFVEKITESEIERREKAEANQEMRKVYEQGKAEETKGFKVGDFVVLSKDLLKQHITEEVIEAVNLQTVFEVLNIENGVYYLDKKMHLGETWTMEEWDIEHAPAESPKVKALEFGAPAIVIGNTSDHGFTINQTVLIGEYNDTEDCYECVGIGTCGWGVSSKDLKAL